MQQRDHGKKRSNNPCKRIRKVQDDQHGTRTRYAAVGKRVRPYGGNDGRT